MGIDVRKCFACARMTPVEPRVCVYCGRAPAPRRPPTPRRPRPPGPRPPAAGAPASAAGRSCAACGRAAAPGAEACAACGGALSEPREHFLVVVARAPVRLVAGVEFVIGRDGEADLVAYSADVSRQHAVIRWDGKEPPRPLLAELRSSNGTWLNERRLPVRTPVRLCSGDAIRLGETFRVLYYHLSAGELRREIELRGAVETRRYPGGVPTPTEPLRRP